MRSCGGEFVLRNVLFTEEFVPTCFKFAMDIFKPNDPRIDVEAG